MAKILSSVPSTWFKYLSLVSQRSFTSNIKGSWNEPPICKGRKISRKDKKCHPKQPSCLSGLSACGHIQWPKCDEPESIPPPHLKCCCDYDLSKDPCEPAPKKKRKHKEEKPFKSMWETCGIEKECPDAVPRLDETHYQPSDKLKRVYTKTWKSCDPVIRKRKVCCFNEMCTLPPLEKRCKSDTLETAKEKDSDQLKVDYNLIRKCIENIPKNPNTTRPNRCVKIVMPCCRKVAKNLICHRNRGHSKCVKVCCPYPSFAECDHPKFRRTSPDECHCHEFTHQCETNRFALRKNRIKLPPPVPAWPPKERPK